MSFSLAHCCVSGSVVSFSCLNEAGVMFNVRLTLLIGNYFIQQSMRGCFYWCSHVSMWHVLHVRNCPTYRPIEGERLLRNITCPFRVARKRREKRGHTLPSCWFFSSWEELWKPQARQSPTVTLFLHLFTTALWLWATFRACVFLKPLPYHWTCGIVWQYFVMVIIFGIGIWNYFYQCFWTQWTDS